MTRMIERWFPCQEVTSNSARGWGSGNSEVMLFSWFAKRPLAQARAAVLTSLLPWPDDVEEQERMRDLVREAMGSLDAVSDELISLIPKDSRLLDPFSGRGMIPLESARLGVPTFAVDLSPVACTASRCLVEHPLRDWGAEPALPFGGASESLFEAERLVCDVGAFCNEVHQRVVESVGAYYPKEDGRLPWAYLWAETIPCQECELIFPLIGSLALRQPSERRSDPGQSLMITFDEGAARAQPIVAEGAPQHQPTRMVPYGKSKYDAAGKVALCPRCGHQHAKEVQLRLTQAATSGPMLLAVADNDEKVQRTFRTPTPPELAAASKAAEAVEELQSIVPELTAVPDELIPFNNAWTMQGQAYGAKRFADLSMPRQNLLLAATARAIQSLASGLQSDGVSSDYAACLADYACAVLARRLKFSTRGARLRAPKNGVNISDVFGNSESSWSYQLDYLETGLADGPGTWQSLTRDMLAVLRKQLARRAGSPCTVLRGSATSLPFLDHQFTAIVTDPPYDAMIEYSDASDMYFVWMKRAMYGIRDEFLSEVDSLGLQDKTEELIVKKGAPAGDHRTRSHYDDGLTRAFSEARQKLSDGGVLAIVFGHGDPEVWHRLLQSMSASELVLTGSWPARTEKKTGGANIETTLTLACRPATRNRSPGRVADVDAEVRREVYARIPLWERAGLALTDQLMASAGPAMEIVGRYSEILDKRGLPVDLDRYLPLARRFVEEAASIKIDKLPLETFDARTRFALFWARVYGRRATAASEARWLRLASDLSEAETAGLVIKDGKGVRLVFASETNVTACSNGPVIDTVLAVAATGRSVAGVAEVLLGANRTEDSFIWAAMSELSRLLPETDPDGDVWTWVVRNRSVIAGASHNVEAARVREEQQAQSAGYQGSFFGGDG